MTEVDADITTDTGSGTSRAAAGMGAITAVSRVIGLARVVVVAAVLGTSDLGDAFQSSNSVSNVLFELLAAGALSAVLVPSFVRLLAAGDDRRAEEVAGRVLGVALLVLGAVSLLGVVFAPLLAHALTAGARDSIATEQRDLVTFLLRLFVPQVMLYAAGTIAAAVLYAKRRFAITAAAPIGNTVVMVICLGIFRVVAGSDPGLDLSTGERWLLALAGTGGVIGFVGLLLIACRAAGFRLRPRLLHGDRQVVEVLRHSGWGVALHTAGGLLLGAAIVCGSGVEGAVIAYQVGWVFFLAPYAILAQPIHTAILPELVTEAHESGLARVGGSLRWGLERIGLFILPVTAAMIALAGPAMRLVPVGEGDGTDLLAAAVAGLAVGLYAYSTFLLFSRGYYALGESRWPGLVAIGSALAGTVVMALSAAFAEGTARVALLGLGHSAAYSLGAVVLAVGLARRTGVSIWPAALGRMVGLSAVVGLAAWLGSRAVLGSDPSRLADLLVLLVAGAVGGAVVLGGYQALGVFRSLTPRTAA
ncbi:MAG TPA: lipid II flippase MurJ [Acidimicrobiales bacterium]|jgi:putative peptidoglycan lipid II flippase